MNPDDLYDSFDKLNFWKASGQRAPHKPLLALWAIGRCLRGNNRMVSYREASHALKLLLIRFGPPRKKIHPEDPFWRLQFDEVWEVSDSDRISVTTSGGAHVSSLLREDAHGGFPEKIYSTLRTNTQLAFRIVYLLLDAHFPQTLHDDVLQAVGIESEFEYVKRRSRNRHFSDEVLTAYGHRCVVCNFAIRMGKDPIALEAAHIRWHCAQGPDLVRNALALCALHHRLFDVGAFTLSSDRKIMVSAHATGIGYDDALGRFHSNDIYLPENVDDSPDSRFIKWHHHNVFDCPLPMR